MTGLGGPTREESARAADDYNARMQPEIDAERDRIYLIVPLIPEAYPNRDAIVADLYALDHTLAHTSPVSIGIGGVKRLNSKISIHFACVEGRFMDEIRRIRDLPIASEELGKVAKIRAEHMRKALDETICKVADKIFYARGIHPGDRDNTLRDLQAFRSSLEEKTDAWIKAFGLTTLVECINRHFPETAKETPPPIWFTEIFRDIIQDGAKAMASTKAIPWQIIAVATESLEGLDPVSQAIFDHAKKHVTDTERKLILPLLSFPRKIALIRKLIPSDYERRTDLMTRFDRMIRTAEFVPPELIGESFDFLAMVLSSYLTFAEEPAWATEIRRIFGLQADDPELYAPVPTEPAAAVA